MPCFLISDKNWAIDTISKKKSQMVENWNISENRGGRKFFWKLRQSLNFCPISKNKASNCSEEQSPSIQIPKKSVSTKLGGGEPVHFHMNNFLGVSRKFRGSRPPKYIYIYFYYFFYKGIALPNNLPPSVSKSEKNWAIDAIKKKNFCLPSPPPLFAENICK